MIDWVNIEGFRGIKRSESKIPLTDFTIIVGKNNSGKTSVLESLYSVYHGSDKLFGNWHSDVIKNLHSGKKLAYRYSGEGVIELAKDGNGYQQSVNGSVATNRNIGDSSDVIYYPPSFKSLNKILSRLQGMRDEIERRGAHIDVAEFINGCIDDEYTEIYLETLEMRKKPLDGQQFYVDINDLGDGVVRAIPVYLLVETLEPELFLWDDITTSLHPGLMRNVIEWLAQKDTQFVGATHSIDVLSTLIDIQPDTEVSVIQLTKSGDDVLKHNALSLEELELMMENAGHDPRFMVDELEL